MQKIRHNGGPGEELGGDTSHAGRRCETGGQRYGGTLGSNAQVCAELLDPGRAGRHGEAHGGTGAQAADQQGEEGAACAGEENEGTGGGGGQLGA